MPHHRSHRGTPRAPRLVAILTLAVSLAGCSIWDLGPEPSNYIGQGRSGARPLTDPTLQAVIPEVPGDRGIGVALPGTVTTAPGAGTNPASMPAATQPTTVLPALPGTATRPDAQPALGQAGAMSPASLTPAAPGRAEVPPSLSVQDAILTGLQNNTNLRVQRYSVPLRRFSEEQALANFDPTVSGSIQGGATNSGTRTTNSINGSASVSEFLPTGTTISASVSSNNSFYSDAPSSTASATATVTQSLLRGAGLDVNLASLRQAELATKSTQYQLRGIAETLVQNIETTYWDLAFAERQMIIVQNALDVAQEQYDATATRVQRQTLAESELASARAELARRKENLIDARSTLEKTRMSFLQLITPAPQEFWNRTIALTTLPFIPTGAMDPVDAHVAVALRLRPDVNQAKLEIQRGDLQIVQTKNGLLPRMDLFVTLGKTGFASAFGESVTNLNGQNYQALFGVKGDWDPINRAALATYHASVLTREQLDESLDNLYQTVQSDVRNQYIEVVRTRLQIDATRVTREAQETSLAVQQAKLAAGRGTSLDVSLAQRDLLSDQLSEVQAVTNHLKALVTLYRLEGSLLYRRGLDAPGATPVEGPAWRK